MIRGSGTHKAGDGSPKRGTRLGLYLAVGITGLGLFAGLAGYLRGLERDALSGGVNDDVLAGRIRAIAKVREFVGAMKLLTVELRTSVNLTVRDESWRGDVAATVEAPVRMFFGTDLGRAEVAWGQSGPATRILRIIAPPPERLATEVIGEGEATDVSVGWLRFRSRAGEYYLGQARKGLYDAARSMTLSEKDSARVRDETRARLVETASKFLQSPETVVKVAFADE